VTQDGERHPRLHNRFSFRDSSAVQRLIVTGALGVMIGAGFAVIAPWQFALLAGWDAAGATLVAWVWRTVHQLDANDTHVYATREDNSRASTHVFLIGASVAGLVGTGLDLVKASQTGGNGKLALTLIAVLTVAVSWAVVHTVFALRYAHEFYTPPIGGIDFKNGPDDLPDYQDFAYVAFTVGMTFQVSDTDIQARTIRRTVLRQALLAYLFGAVILAVTVNVIAGIVQ
jgi:uncharacterized membrane protein